MSKQAVVRAALEKALHELLDRAKRIDSHQHERDREVPKDWDELAQYRENDEVVDQLDDMTRAEIRRIEAALQRMDQGTWGICSRCEDAIEPARLEAVPTAGTCLACLAEIDRQA